MLSFRRIIAHVSRQALQDKSDEILLHTLTDQDNCKIWQGQVDKDGYGVVNFQSDLLNNVKWCRTHIILLANQNYDRIIAGNYNPRYKYSSSHLCNKPGCQLHLSAEPHYVNCSRKTCARLWKKKRNPLYWTWYILSLHSISETQKFWNSKKKNENKDSFDSDIQIIAVKRSVVKKRKNSILAAQKKKKNKKPLKDFTVSEKKNIPEEKKITRKNLMKTNQQKGEKRKFEENKIEDEVPVFKQRKIWAPVPQKQENINYFPFEEKHNIETDPSLDENLAPFIDPVRESRFRNLPLPFSSDVIFTDCFSL